MELEITHPNDYGKRVKVYTSLDECLRIKVSGILSKRVCEILEIIYDYTSMGDGKWN